MAWYTTNADQNIGRASKRQSERQSASEPRDARMWTNIPFESLFARPVEIPSTKVSKPMPREVYKPGYHRNNERQIRLAQARERRLKVSNAHAERQLKLAAYRSIKRLRLNPYGLAFRLGMEIGEAIFGEPGVEIPPGFHSNSGLYNPMYEIVTNPNTTAVPVYWWNSQYSAQHTAATLHPTGGLPDNYFSAWGTGTEPAGWSPLGKSSSQIFAETGSDILLGVPSVAGYWSESWAGLKVPGANSVDLTVAYENYNGGGIPKPVVEVPMEFPDAWPQGVVVKPVPQKWADAVPEKGTQADEDYPGHGEGLQSSRTITDIATRQPTPLLPVPVFEVVVDPGTVPAVPDTIIAPEDTLEPVRWRGNTGKRKRPDKNTKEKKINVASVGGKVWIALNVATELQDFLEAMHKGLDKKYRSRPYKFGAKISPHQILSDIWKHHEHWHPSEALAAFVNNQIEDMFYGKMGKASAKASREMGIHTGLGSAQSQARGNVQDYSEAAGIQNEISLPKLSYDRASDQWTVSIPFLPQVSIGH